MPGFALVCRVCELISDRTGVSVNAYILLDIGFVAVVLLLPDEVIVLVVVFESAGKVKSQTFTDVLSKNIELNNDDRALNGNI